MDFIHREHGPAEIAVTTVQSLLVIVNITGNSFVCHKEQRHEVSAGIPILSATFCGGTFEQLARYTMRYQVSDLHLGLYSSLTSANNINLPTLLTLFYFSYSSLLTSSSKVAVL